MRRENEGEMLEILALTAHLLDPPDPTWRAKKRLVRERVAEVVATANRIHSRDDELPQLVLARLPGRHGEFAHAWNRLTLDLESLHDSEKFWHVYRETVPHEWAHALNRRLHDARGHGAQFAALLEDLRG